MSNYTPPQNDNSIIEYVPLPLKAQIQENLGNDACPWLDEYIAHSRKWSTRSYDGYHEAIGLWVLSTVAARRVSFHFGKRRYTNLLIALIGRTSITAKSSAAQIGKDVLNDAKLDWLLLPDTCTPQKMINEMALRVPDHYQELTAEKKERVQQKLAFAGQRGWYHDEFGMLVAGLMRPDGAMADFRGHLRRFDDTEERFENATIARGLEVIERPYLALLACLTPADLRPFAKKGAALWGDGFLARFALVTPEADFIANGRFPKGERDIPVSLITALRKWHEALGVPKVEIVSSNVDVTAGPPQVLTLSDTVRETYYAYDDALRGIIATMSNSDMDGNYSRLPEKGLRLAALLASHSFSPTIEINHWARAQEICERWRMNLHSLYGQLNDQGSSTKTTIEDKVLKIIHKKGDPTKREIEQYTGLDGINIENALDTLLDIKEIIKVPDGRTTRYMKANKVGSPDVGEPY